MKNLPEALTTASVLAFPAQPARAYTDEAATFLTTSLGPALNDAGYTFDAAIVEYIAAQLSKATTLRLPDASTVCGAGHLPLTIAPAACRALHMPHAVTALVYTHVPAVGEYTDAIRRVTLVLDIIPHTKVGPFARYIDAIEGFSAGGGMIVVALYALLDRPCARQHGSARSDLSSGLWYIDPSVALIPRQPPRRMPAWMPVLPVAGLRVALGLVQPDCAKAAIEHGEEIRSQIADPVYTALQVATNSVRPLSVTPRS